MCVSMVYPFVHFPPMFVRESRSMYGSCAEPLAIDRHVSWFARGRSPFTHRTPLWSQTHRGLKTNIGSRAEKSVHQKGESGEEAAWHRSEVSVTFSTSHPVSGESMLMRFSLVPLPNYLRAGTPGSKRSIANQ